MKKIAIFAIFLFLLFSCSEKRNFCIKLLGIIEGKDFEISSKIAGRIKEIYVDEGDLVRENQIIAVIDSSDYEIQKKQIEAMVESASANLKLLERGARSEMLK